MLALLLLLLCTPAVEAAGFTVHQTNSYRALTTPLASTPRQRSFMTLLRDNKGAVYAGSPAPDWGYECGPNHDDGEYMHWSPYQAVSAAYIRETYPEPRSASGQVLVAFTAGVASHYMADISWHGLAETTSGYGLIEHVGAMDFNATGELNPSAHTAVDLGGEFVVAYEDSLSWLDPTAWVIPTADIVRIYQRANRSDFTAAVIDECVAIFFAGTEAVKAAAALAEPALTTTAPTLGESFSDMYVGGVDDMSVMIGRIWGRLAQWVAEGPPQPVPGHEYCTPQNPCASRPQSPPVDRSPLRAHQEAMRLLGGAIRKGGLVEEARTAQGALTLRAAPHSTPATMAALLVQELSARAAAAAAASSSLRGQHPSQKAGVEGHKGQGWAERRRQHLAQPRNVSWTAAQQGDACRYRFYGALKLLVVEIWSVVISADSFLYAV
jgi:hypothetical protein